MPSLSIVVVLVSGRCFPRSICVQFHVPVKKIIEEKSGLAVGTIVGAGAGCAHETSGEVTNATTAAAALTANITECFIFSTLSILESFAVFRNEESRRWESMQQTKGAMNLLMRFNNEVALDLLEESRGFSIMIDRLGDPPDTVDLADD